MILPVSNRTADGADAGCFSGIGKQPALFAGRIHCNTRTESCTSHSANPVHSRKQSAGCFRICQKQPAPFYLSDIFKQNLRQSSSRPFPRCWFAHGSRQTIRDRCRACFSTNRVWARCAHSIRLHPPKRSIRRCAR